MEYFMGSQTPWIYISVFVLVALLIPIAAIAIAAFLGPKKPNAIKQSTYECGIETVGDSWIQFKAEYYIFALVFLIFDVETVFLFPWAVVMKDLGMVAFIEVLIFLGILGLGLLYAWKKDALKWEN